jgi:hypothetical protein
MQSRKARLLAFATLMFPVIAMGQQTRPVLKPLPADMDCGKVLGDTVTVPSGSETLIKRGSEFYLCRPKSATTLQRAQSAAVVVRSTQTITCGDGSSNDCLREDTSTKTKIEAMIDETDLWRYFKQAAATKADIILKFVANNRADSSSPVSLTVQDSDSGDIVFSESRQVSEMENDVNRLIEHFVTKTGRPPLYSKAELEKAHECARLANQLEAVHADYEEKLAAHTFKTTHMADAQMDECNLHWKEFVCLAKGSGMYAENWRESGLELQRKLDLEFEELHNIEQQMATLRQNLCK